MLFLTLHDQKAFIVLTLLKKAGHNLIYLIISSSNHILITRIFLAQVTGQRMYAEMHKKAAKTRQIYAVKRDYREAGGSAGLPFADANGGGGTSASSSTHRDL